MRPSIFWTALNDKLALARHAAWLYLAARAWLQPCGGVCRFATRAGGARGYRGFRKSEGPFEELCRNHENLVLGAILGDSCPGKSQRVASRLFWSSL